MPYPFPRYGVPREVYPEFNFNLLGNPAGARINALAINAKRRANALALDKHKLTTDKFNWEQRQEKAVLFTRGLPSDPIEGIQYIASGIQNQEIPTPVIGGISWEQLSPEQQLEAYIPYAQKMKDKFLELSKEAQIASDFGLDRTEEGLRKIKTMGHKPAETWGEPYKDEFGNFLQKSTTGKIRKVTAPPTGFEFVSDGKGGFTLTQTRGGTGASLSKPIQTQLQEDVIGAEDSIARLRDSLSGFQRKYQTVPFRGRMAWEELKQKFGKTPSPEISELLTEFKVWLKDANEDYAITIQSLGKGNLTKNEQKLYGGTLPDPGTGIWPEDAPDVYINAVVDRIQDLTALIARRNYYLNPSGMGLDASQYQNLVAKGKVETVDEMLKKIDEVGEQLEAKYKKAGLNATGIMQAVFEDLAELFGDIF